MSEWVEGSRNVFSDLGFDPAEAEVLKVKVRFRSDLCMANGKLQQPVNCLAASM